MPARGSGNKAAQGDVMEVPTPGQWVAVSPGVYQWREGTAKELHEAHEDHTIHRTATGWTSEHGTWVFTGLPDVPGDATEASVDTVEDIDRQMADLAARKARLQASGE